MWKQSYDYTLRIHFLNKDENEIGTKDFTVEAYCVEDANEMLDRLVDQADLDFDTGDNIDNWEVELINEERNDEERIIDYEI